MKKKYQSSFIIVILLLFLFLCLFNSKHLISIILEYSSLFLTKLFPVSFIFFMISFLLIEYGFIERIQYFFHIKAASFYVFFISLISGFPAGIVCVCDLLSRNMIDKEEANKMIQFSHFPNFLFIFGSVSLVLNKSITNKLYLALFISNFIIFISKKYKNEDISFDIPNPDDFSSLLRKAITHSFDIILFIYGISLFFHLLLALIIPFFSLSSYSYVFLNGIFDLTKGVFSTSILNNIVLRAYFILFFIQFGGISIHMQVKGFLINSNLSYFSFIKGRIIGILISFIIFSILLLF